MTKFYGYSTAFRECKIQFVQVIVLLSIMNHVACEVFHPPFFNAALRKPVTSYPADATCGERGEENYCESLQNEQSTLTCFTEKCSNRCPNGESWPSYKTVLYGFDTRVYSLGGCVDVSSFTAPTIVGEQSSLRFSGTGNNCNIPLLKEWLSPIVYLNRIWQTTFTLWIYNELGLRTGTILDAFYNDAGTDSVFLVTLNKDRLEIRSGATLLNNNFWIIPQNTWTHIGIQLYNKSLSVLINGELAGTAYYQVGLRENNNAINWWVGKSHSRDYDPFVGYMQDFRIHFDVLVNRGIRSLFNNGTIETIRIYSHCICPRDYPRIKETEPTFCVQNPGSGASSNQDFRLSRSAHALQYVNDNARDRSWMTSSPLEEVTVEIDMLDVFQVRHVHIDLYSPVPALITISRQQNATSPWQPWQYFSEDCRGEVGIETNKPMLSPNDITCKEMINFDKQHIYSGAAITFDLLAGRPGMLNRTMTSQLRYFLQARAIRVTLKGHPFVNNAGHKYHAISEIIVNATCDCNGHGSDCQSDRVPYVCTCAQESFTSGEQCEACADNAYQVTTDGASPQCAPCDCVINGTVHGAATCDMTNGQCECKQHVTGRHCNACADGYFNLTNENTAGCDSCNCNTNGTVDGSQRCDMETGQCTCKDNVDGLKCDRCKSGFTSFSGDHVAGCLGCSCNDAGVVTGNDTCDKYTAICRCKQNVRGRDCDECVEGTYNLQAKNEAGCQPCLCNTTFGAFNRSCNSISGQCYCAPNVTGLNCDRCQSGYYGDDIAGIQKNGCSKQCDCNSRGVDERFPRACAQVGGQCTCKDGVTGRSCDQCLPGGYGFGVSDDTVCKSCDCDVRGRVNISCDDNGACACKPHVMGQKCDQCEPTYYGLGMSDKPEEGCLPCDCFVEGTVDGSVCNNTTGQCKCKEIGGQAAYSDRKCSPYVVSIMPNYGPRSGGTNITMRVGYMGSLDDVTIHLGSIDCPIDFSTSNDTVISCRSSRMNNSVELNIPQEVKLHVTAEHYLANTKSKFTYKNDPKIADVSPLKTFARGGVVLTVTGQYLDSVMFPYMTVSLIQLIDQQETRTTFISACKVANSSVMLCPTPEIKLPNNRRKRSAETEVSVHNDRLRRQASDLDDLQTVNNDTVNNDTVKFYLGFILDGVESYRNWSEVSHGVGILTVYRDPELEMFPEERHIKPFRKYWPKHEKHITILGRRLNYGCSDKDYRIVIGDSECTDIKLLETSIVCFPPADEPGAIDSSSGDFPEHPQAIVHVGNIRFLVGYLEYQTSIWNYDPFRYGIIGAACGLFLLFIIVLAACLVCKSRAKKQEEHMARQRPTSYISAYETKDGVMRTYMATLTGDIITMLPGELRMTVTDLMIDIHQLEIGKIIGQGHFGEVHIGFYTEDGNAKPEPVAIKKLKDDPQRSRQETINFLEEATVMKDFQHNNVLSLIGVVVHGEEVVVVLPYMENGDLQTFISREENMLTVGELIHFGLQIASGMTYLSDQRFVHRDLACRNVMVNKNLIVKIADFGLSRDIYEKDYYRVNNVKRPLPVKWMAIESLDNGVWSVKSDVWSYGVVLWELLTRGCAPYPNVNMMDMKLFLLAGNRMDRPDYAPDEIYLLMLSCWQEDPERRPTFKQIRDRMSYFLNEVNTHTFLRDKQGQQVPSSLAYRKHNYLELLP